MKDPRDDQFKQLEADLFPKHDDFLGEESAANMFVNLDPKKRPRELTPEERKVYIEESQKMWDEIKEMFRSRK